MSRNLIKVKAIWPKSHTISNTSNNTTMTSFNEQPTKPYLPGFTALNDTLNEDISKLLPLLLNRIKKKLFTCEAVFFLGTLKTETAVLYFLVITSNEEQRDGSSLNNMIEDSCREIAPVSAFVHNANTVVSAARKVNYFFSSILLHKRLLYLSGNMILPTPGALDYRSIIPKTVATWERWHQMSLDFIAGCEFYMKESKFRLALFLLHQSAESILKAINRAVTGYRIEVHNLSRLLVISTLYTQDLTNVFPLKTEKGIMEFDLLKRAYSESRYKDDFDPEEAQVRSLYGHVQRLQVGAERLYLAHLSNLDSTL